ncbi:MAG: permease prefix domain 2-containing transporter [Anaerolineae bacterium]|nr:permease prefix domain 2-containing transporter [Anaerolineae bacterium]MCI0609980.1 permease prefix domain 2-containing transporter [Anaerolineae bacterium]
MTYTLHPPKIAERFLTSMLTQDNAEVVLGDFEELFHINAAQSNLQKAQSSYWIQLLKSAPFLIHLKLSNEFERILTAMIKNMNLHNKPSLLVSLIALIPALLLVIPGIMQSGLGITKLNDAIFANVPSLLFSPAILLGGLLIAFVLNIIPAIKLHFERQPEGLTSVITFRPVLLHWIFVGMSVLMVGIILIYAFFENFTRAFH